MNLIPFNGERRTDLGKKSSTMLRRDGKIPCVLYGAKEVVHFYTTPNEVKNIIYTPDFKVAELNVDGSKYRCIVKDFQLHPLSNELVHIDFLNLVDGHSIKVEVPIRFRGISPGVKLGGKLIQSVRRVKIKTLPEDLVDEVIVDISTLDLGQSLRVRDIETPKGTEIMNAPGIPVVLIEIPRALRSAAAAAEKDTKKKK